MKTTLVLLSTILLFPAPQDARAGAVKYRQAHHEVVKQAAKKAPQLKVLANCQPFAKMKTVKDADEAIFQAKQEYSRALAAAKTYDNSCRNYKHDLTPSQQTAEMVRMGEEAKRASLVGVSAGEKGRDVANKIKKFNAPAKKLGGTRCVQAMDEQQKRIDEQKAEFDKQAAALKDCSNRAPANVPASSHAKVHNKDLDAAQKDINEVRCAQEGGIWEGYACTKPPGFEQ